MRPGLLLSLLVMLTGCDAVAILSPKGQIGQDEKTLLITATVLMLLVVIPVIIMTLTFAWKYRASNTKARYEPKWSHLDGDRGGGVVDPLHDRAGAGGPDLAFVARA